MNMLRYLLFCSVVFNCVASDFVKLPDLKQKHNIVWKFRGLDDLEQQIVKRDLNFRNNMIIGIYKQKIDVNGLDQYRWIASKKYKSSIDFIENAVIDCLSCKGCFSKDYRRGSQSIDKFDELSVKNSRFDDLIKKYGELVNFDVLPSDNWTVSNWNAFFFNNYIYRVLPQSNKRYQKDLNNKYSPIDTNLFGAMSVDKILALIKTLVISEFNINDVSKIEKAISDVRSYIYSLNLNRYIANFATGYKAFAKYICETLNLANGTEDDCTLHYNINSRYNIDLKIDNSYDRVKITGFRYTPLNTDLNYNDFYINCQICDKDDGYKSLNANYQFKNFLEKNYYENGNKVFYAYLDNATILSKDNIKYTIDLDESKKINIIENDKDCEIDIPDIDDYNFFEKKKIISGDRIIDNFAPILYAGDINYKDDNTIELVNTIKNIKGYKQINEQIKEIEIGINFIKEMQSSLRIASEYIDNLLTLEERTTKAGFYFSSNVDLMIDYAQTDTENNLTMMKSYLLYKFKFNTNIRNEVNEITDLNSLRQKFNVQDIKEKINNFDIADDYGIILTMISSINDECVRLNEQAENLRNRQKEIDNLFNAQAKLDFNQFDTTQRQLLQNQCIKYEIIYTKRKDNENVNNAIDNKQDTKDMNLIEYIKYVINLSDDILGDDKVVDKKERFDEAELYHVMELIQLGKFNTNELDDCIEILMNSNPSKTENDRTGDTIIYLNNVKEELNKINKSKETMQYITKQFQKITQNTFLNEPEQYIVDVDYVKELFSNINSDDIGLYNFIEQFKGSYNISDLKQNNITPQLIISYFRNLDYILKNILLKSNNKNTNSLDEFRTNMKLQYNILSINDAIDEVIFCLNGNEIDSKFEQFGLSEDEIKKQKENTLQRLNSIKNSLVKLEKDIKNIL